jgi:hypothetical protein
LNRQSEELRIERNAESKTRSKTRIIHKVNWRNSLMVKLAWEIRILMSQVQQFVDKARRLKGLKEYDSYEPPLDQSHIWAELVGVVQMAEDVLEDLKDVT